MENSQLHYDVTTGQLSNTEGVHIELDPVGSTDAVSYMGWTFHSANMKYNFLFSAPTIHCIGEESHHLCCVFFQILSRISAISTLVALSVSSYLRYDGSCGRPSAYQSVDGEFDSRLCCEKLPVFSGRLVFNGDSRLSGFSWCSDFFLNITISASDNAIFSLFQIIKKTPAEQRDIFRPKGFYNYMNLRLKNSQCIIKTQRSSKKRKLWFIFAYFRGNN